MIVLIVEKNNFESRSFPTVYPRHLQLRIRNQHLGKRTQNSHSNLRRLQFTKKKNM